MCVCVCVYIYIYIYIYIITPTVRKTAIFIEKQTHQISLVLHGEVETAEASEFSEPGY